MLDCINRKPDSSRKANKQRQGKAGVKTKKELPYQAKGQGLVHGKAFFTECHHRVNAGRAAGTISYKGDRIGEDTDKPRRGKPESPYQRTTKALPALPGH